MATKIYGGRWERVDNLEIGSGGQSKVYRVRDLTGAYPEEAALKRVTNIKRQERFRREIEAIKTLTDPAEHAAHPNIVSLIEHSALDDDAVNEKQYLVMPIAKGGDLGQPGTVARYKDALDSTLIVAKQIAEALRVAHAADIIHRDVKPANILFTGNGHDLWLSDFGICFLREKPAITEFPEVMGPFMFMAPELEYGGHLDVAPSVDLYSLGKVIYFMLSGGIVIPRERLHERRYATVFEKSGRYQLVGMLLDRLICDQGKRIQAADEVIREIAKIEQWEQTASSAAVSSVALAGLDAWKKKSADSGRIMLSNQQARDEEGRALGAAQTSLTEWLKGQLDAVAAVMRSNTITCTVRDAGIPNGFRVQTGHTSLFTPISGVELVVNDANEPMARVHSLQVFICHSEKLVNTVRTGPRNPLPQERPVRDLTIALLPFYRQSQRHLPNQYSAQGYPSQKAMVGKMRGQMALPAARGRGGAPQVSHRQVAAVMETFEREVSLHHEFTLSAWPGNVDAIRTMLTEAIEAFIAKANG